MNENKLRNSLSRETMREKNGSTRKANDNNRNQLAAYSYNGYQRKGKQCRKYRMQNYRFESILKSIITNCKKEKIWCLELKNTLFLRFLYFLSMSLKQNYFFLRRSKFLY